MRPNPLSPLVNVVGVLCLVAPALCMTGLVAWWARGLRLFAMSVRRGESLRYRRVRPEESGWKPSRSAGVKRPAERWKQQS